jgi:hypothetical protein
MCSGQRINQLKRLLFFWMISAVFACSATTASAYDVIFYGKGYKFEATKPLSPRFVENNRHLNFGIAYRQFSVFWIPVWNYEEGQYVLITDDEKTAYELSEADLKYLKEIYDVDADSPPAISFWNKAGGKLVWGSLLLGIIFLCFWGIRKTARRKNKNHFIDGEIEARKEIALKQTSVKFPIGKGFRKISRNFRKIKPGIKNKRTKKLRN